MVIHYNTATLLVQILPAICTPFENIYRDLSTTPKGNLKSFKMFVPFGPKNLHESSELGNPKSYVQ